MQLVTPDGWEHENSPSTSFGFTSHEESPERLKFLRHEVGNDVYLDQQTGKEIFFGRSSRDRE